MMYPFLTLDDGTEIVHSEMGSEDVLGFSEGELSRLREVIESTAHLILQFSKEGGFENAASF